MPKRWLLAAPDSAPASQSVAATDQGNGQAGIWVNGIGTKDVEADVAVISLGVESREETVAAARSAAAASMTSVLDALGTLGVADDDIVTTSLNIYPIQVWIEVEDDVGSHNEPRITGYVVNNQVRVTVRDIEMADEAIDKAAEVGGDLIRINNVSFTVGDPAAHADEIRRRAVEDAKAKAELYAEAFGVEIGAAGIHAGSLWNGADQSRRSPPGNGNGHASRRKHTDRIGRHQPLDHDPGRILDTAEFGQLRQITVRGSRTSRLPALAVHRREGRQFV